MRNASEDPQHAPCLGFNPRRLASYGELTTAANVNTHAHARTRGDTQYERDLLGGPALPFHKVLDPTLRAITNTHK